MSVTAEGTLEGHGVRGTLPQGWSGRIFRPQMESPDVSTITLHAGNFAIPLDDDGFGTEVTSYLEPGRIAVIYVEYQPDEVLRPNDGMYSAQGTPTELTLEMFGPNVLQVARQGHLGYQDFFSLGTTRIGILYVVLGGAEQSEQALAEANALLGSLEFATTPDADDYRPVRRGDGP